VPLCAMAEVATGTAVNVLNQGPIRRRNLPARSLAQKNACTLLAPEALGNVVPGIDASHPVADYAGWACSWDSTTQHLLLDVRFELNQPLTAADGRPTQLRGYQVFIQPRGDGDGTCVARVVYRTYVDKNNDHTSELLSLKFEGPSSTSRLCSMATRLADSAADALSNA
jgi:hypothetical protein